ncbi:hypothetical protein GCM10022258_29760 [Aquimarina gracilis]
MLNSIVAFFSRRPNLGRIKIILFPVLVGGISFDWLVGYNFASKQLEVSSGTDEILIPILMVSIFIIMLFANLWDRHRERKIIEKKIELLDKPSTTEAMKMEILRQIDQ